MAEFDNKRGVKITSNEKQPTVLSSVEAPFLENTGCNIRVTDIVFPEKTLVRENKERVGFLKVRNTSTTKIEREEKRVDLVCQDSPPIELFTDTTERSSQQVVRKGRRGADVTDRIAEISGVVIAVGVPITASVFGGPIAGQAASIASNELHLREQATKLIRWPASGIGLLIPGNETRTLNSPPKITHLNDRLPVGVAESTISFEVEETKTDEDK